MRTIIFTIFVLLAMAFPIYADCGHAVCQPTVAVPVVNEVIVPVPVFVPTFQFQYQPPVCMPAAIPPASSPLGLSSDENIKALAKAIMEQMKKDGVSFSTGTGKVEDDDGPPMVVEVGAVAAPSPPLSTASTSFAILNNRCAKCHTGKLADGGFSIFESPGKLEQNLDWDSIVRAVSTGRMPKEAQKNPKLALSQAEIQTLKNRR